MRTVCSLTISRDIYHAHLPPPRMPPCNACPLPCTPCHACPQPCMLPPCMPLPCPCHACSLPCMPLLPPMLPLPCTPPAMHAPYHTCPPCMPPAMHAPLLCTPPYHACPHAMHNPPATQPPLPHMPPAMHTPLWTETLTHATQNITLPKTSSAGGKNFPWTTIHKTIYGLVRILNGLLAGNKCRFWGSPPPYEQFPRFPEGFRRFWHKMGRTV